MTTGRSMAAIVFTDMVASTELRIALGEQKADELRRIHDRLLSSRVEANHGRILRYTGDGLVAAFPAASEALTAAVEFQQATASYSRRRNALGDIRLRVGVSIGEVSWEDGDCFGIPLVEAARLEAAAGSGRILCSEQTRITARGRGGHAFRSIGFLELKGLPEPLAACEVVWEPEADQPPFPLPAELQIEASRPFVGREAELALARGLIDDPDRKRLAVLWLLGEPGIGKTRLATEIARQAHSAGAVVLFGRCSEDVAIPYQPFLEALNWFVPLVPDTELADRVGDAPGELMRLNAEIGRRIPELEPSPFTAPETGQHRLFESVRSWLAAAGSGRQVVAVLDDVHWGSRPTLALLGHVARSAEESRTLLVCTARNTSPDKNQTLAGLIEELPRRGTPGGQIRLGGLSEDALGRLLASLTGRPHDASISVLATRIHGETAGNPLYVDALVADLSADPNWGFETGRTLMAAVGRRVARLGSDVGDVLRAAAVVGLDFALPVLARVVGEPEPAVLRLLEGAGSAGLVQEQAVNHFRFRHALVRSFLLEQLSQSFRVRTHLRVAEAIEVIQHANVEEYAGALSHHFLEALPLGTAGRAYRYLLLTAKRATDLLSHQEAAAAYRKALELLDQAGGVSGLERFRLLYSQGEAQRRAGDMVAALETLRSAAEEAASQGSPDGMARAAVAFEETLYWMGLPGDRALELVEPAVKALPAGDSKLRALTLATMSRTLTTSGRHAEPWRSEALAMAARLGDQATSFGVAFRTTDSAVSVEQAHISAAAWTGLWTTAKELGDEDSYLLALGQLFWARAMLGDPSAGDDLVEEYSRLARQLRQSRWDYWLNLIRAFRAMMAADLDAAEKLLHTAEAIGEGFGWAREGLYGVAMFLIRREQGRLPDVAPVFRAAAALNQRSPLWQPGLAALYLELGRPDDARAQYEAVMSEWAAGMPPDGMRELSVGLMAEVCCALDDTEQASRLLELLRPCEGRFLAFIGCAGGLGPTDRLLGMLASTAGYTEDAELWHRSGLALARRLDSPLWIAHCLYDYAAHRCRSEGDAAGRELLEEAGVICRDRGLVALASRVSRLIERASLGL